jgi:atypical dual specificity phosphatase
LSDLPALVMQNSSLLMSNVLENLVSELPDRASLTQRMQVERVAQLLDQLKLSRLLDCLTQKVIERPLSDHRIIAILRKVMADPALLLLDEPTAGLTQDQTDSLLELIGQLATSRAILVAMHHLQQAQSLHAFVALLANGVIEEFNTDGTFFSAPLSSCAKDFIRTGSCPESSRVEMDAKVDSLHGGVLPAASAQSAYADNTVTPSRSAAWGPRGFLWLLPGQLAGTPLPGIVHEVRHDLEALRCVGITRLITLTETAFDAALAGEFGIGCVHSPMADMHPPTHQQAIVLCQTIDLALAAQEVVAVHCLAGLGRTGTLLTAYWLWRNGGQVSALDALEHVRQIEPGWVQSEAQLRFLEEFAQALGRADLVAAPLCYPPNPVPDVAAFNS